MHFVKENMWCIMTVLQNWTYICKIINSNLTPIADGDLCLMLMIIGRHLWHRVPLKQ
jgi:hypothetical protein